jgi:predicted transcriptional regulator
VTVRVPVGGPRSGSATPVDTTGSEAGFQQALGRTEAVVLRPAPIRAPFKPAPPKAAGQASTGQTSPGQAPTGQAVAQFSTIAERLVGLRRQSGITQVDLAKRMGSTQPALARLEKGDMKPNLRTLSRYGEAIGQRVRVSFAATTAPRGSAAGSAINVSAPGVSAPGASSPGVSSPGVSSPGVSSPSVSSPTEPLPRASLAVCAIDQVPETVAQLRRTLGLTQVQVATAMDSSQPVIARLETGDGIPNLRTLERYCDAIGVEAEIRFESTTPEVV